MDQLKSLGRRFRRIWKKEEELREERAQLAVTLLAALKERGLTSIRIREDLIQIIIQKQRKVSKGRVVAYFGKDVGEEFWDMLPLKVCEYLTVISAPAQAPFTASTIRDV